MVSYFYYTWGKLVSITRSLASTLGVKNPYRYRGYRYDTETGYYYLQSRYYNPTWGRFINADDAHILGLAHGQIHGANLFSYVGNNPVMYEDPSGYIAASTVSGIVGAILTALFDMVGQYFSYWISNNGSFKGFKLNGWSVGLSAVAGFTAGVLMTSTFKQIAQAVGGGIIAGFTNIVNQIINKKSFDLGSLLVDVTVGMLIGAICGPGIGTNFFQKGLFTKGWFVYKGCKYTTSNLQMVRPVFVEFAKALKKYAGGLIADYIVKSVKERI